MGKETDLGKRALIGSRRDRLHAIFPFLGSQPGGVRTSG